MLRGRPKSLSAYEKGKAKKIREYLKEKNIVRFDGINDSALLKTIRISDGLVFVSLDYHDALLERIVQYTSGLKNP